MKPEYGEGDIYYMNYQRHKSEESVEDYLETILILSKQKPQVRSIDVAKSLVIPSPASA